eukprot:1598896-Lingulodinium_polyedra.AAC.1
MFTHQSLSLVVSIATRQVLASTSASLSVAILALGVTAMGFARRGAALPPCAARGACSDGAGWPVRLQRGQQKGAHLDEEVFTAPGHDCRGARIVGAEAAAEVGRGANPGRGHAPRRGGRH